ncbi:MFS transporter [Streptomyces sp. NPDC048507]|uniref:MFS transporter n=1 Tax=Streptomyces sp. NPDC048507 TaxID=3365560 RepID=UPI00371BAD22
MRKPALLSTSPTVRALLITALVNATGTGAFMSGSVLYFSNHLEIPAGTVGLTLSVCALLTLFTTVPASLLLERFGVKQTLIFLHLFRAGGYSAYLLVDSPASFIALTLVLTIVDRLANPASQALLAAVLPAGQRVEIMAWRHAAGNVGVGLGSLAVAVAISVSPSLGYPLVMLLDGASFLVAAALLIKIPAPERAAAPQRGSALFTRRWPGRTYLAFTGISAFFLLSDALMTVALPLWVSERADIAVGTVGVLFLINTAVTVVLQPRLSRGLTGAAAAGRALVQAGCVLAAGATAFLIGDLTRAGAASAALVLGVVLLSVGAARFTAAGWWFSVELAPVDERPRFLAVYSLSATAERVIGPLFVSFVVVRLGAAGWLAAAGVFLACALTGRAFGRAVPPEQPQARGPEARAVRS